MEFNKLAVPASSITINSTQSIQKNEKGIGYGRTIEHRNICIDIRTEVREAERKGSRQIENLTQRQMENGWIKGLRININKSVFRTT
jgi:hypothetical protein